MIDSLPPVPPKSSIMTHNKHDKGNKPGKHGPGSRGQSRPPSAKQEKQASGHKGTNSEEDTFKRKHISQSSNTSPDSLPPRDKNARTETPPIGTDSTVTDQADVMETSATESRPLVSDESVGDGLASTEPPPDEPSIPTSRDASAPASTDTTPLLDSNANGVTNPAPLCLMDASQFISFFANALRDPVIQSLYRDVGIPDVAAREELKKCKTELAELKEQYHNLIQEVEDLKQYTRRNALRVTNPAWQDSGDEDTDERILSLCREFKLSVRREDISRSHRVGKPGGTRPRPILVKFVGYRPRETLMKARKDIRSKYQNIRIDEDLTRATNELAYLARCEKRSKSIKDCWVFDGKVFIKVHPFASPEVVRNKTHLAEIVSNALTQAPTFSDTTARKPANASAVPAATPGAQESRSSPPTGVLQPLGAQSCATLPPHSQTAADGIASTSEPLTMNSGSQSYAAYNSESRPTPHLPQSLPIALLPHGASLAGEPASTMMSQYIGPSQQYMSALQLAPNYALPPPWQFPSQNISLLQCEPNMSNSAGNTKL